MPIRHNSKRPTNCTTNESLTTVSFQLVYSYYMSNTPLQQADHAKYLGDKNLNWNEQHKTSCK